ncbi:MAG: molybdenum cofactor guanylyltransferase [Tenuifilaceae bacterium]
MITLSNFIIIGSAGKNTGKTEFACKLIEKHRELHNIIGVKVVPIDPNRANCHIEEIGSGVCHSLEGDFEITENNILYPDKDTSRMLQSGAQRVFLLKVNVNALSKGLNAFLKLIHENVLVICESNLLRKVVEPGLFIVIRNAEESSIKDSCAEVIHLASKVIQFSKKSWDFAPERIIIKDNSWIIREEATAIILAGGKSSRMRGEDKSLLPINGEPLIQNIYKQLVGHFDEVIIGANDTKKYEFLNLRVVPDVEKDKGPLMGIYSCLKASASNVNFITACDIPVMNLHLIHSMINLSSSYDIVIPYSKNKGHEPLFAVYNKRVINAAEKILGENGRRIIDLLNYSSYKYVDFDSGTWYQNLNEREEYLNFIRK